MPLPHIPGRSHPYVVFRVCWIERENSRQPIRQCEPLGPN